MLNFTTSFKELNPRQAEARKAELLSCFEYLKMRDNSVFDMDPRDGFVSLDQSALFSGGEMQGGKLDARWSQSEGTCNASWTLTDDQGVATRTYLTSDPERMLAITHRESGDRSFERTELLGANSMVQEYNFAS